MLFNKHSESKQRFGIRKLTIGVSSVLLSTLFLTVNNGQKVNAATGNTVTNAGNNKTETDNESVTKENENQTKQTDNATTEVTNTSNEKQATEVEDKNANATTDDSTKVDDAKVAEDKVPDSNDQKSAKGKATSSDTEKQSDKTKADNKLAKLAVNKLAKLAVNKLTVPTDDSTPVLSQSSENGDMNLSISLPELSNKKLSNKDDINQTIKLDATNVNPGDKIVIKVKYGSAYNFAKENLPIGTVTESYKDGYQVFELDINTTAKFEYKITAERRNNYQGQGIPIADTGNLLPA